MVIVHFKILDIIRMSLLIERKTFDENIKPNTSLNINAQSDN